MRLAEDRRKRGIRIRLDHIEFISGKRFDNGKQSQLPTLPRGRENGRSARTKDETHTGTNRCYGQRDGVDRTGSVPMDHLRGPGRVLLPVGNVDVGWNPGCLGARVRTAISYSELNKLYPAPEAPTCSRASVPHHSKYYRFARMAKFVLGWGSICIIGSTLARWPPLSAL